MRNASPLTVLALAAGLALTGCSGDTPSSEAAGSSAASATPSASAEPSSTLSSSPAASTAPTGEAQPGEPARQEPPIAADQQIVPPVAPEDAQVGSPAGDDRRNHPIERPGDLSGPAPVVDRFNHPIERPGDLGGPAPVAPVPQFDFDYDEAYGAWQSGMPYYEAFCIHYEPVTPAGLSQCHGTVAGTVDYVTGAYIGP